MYVQHIDSAHAGKSTCNTAFAETKLFDILPIQYRHIEHLHEEV